MNKKPTTMGQLAAKLSNNKMVKVVASLFHKENFDLTDEGSIELSEEEEERIRKTYGEAFLTKLKATNFSEEGAAKATDLFDEAVRNAAEELAKDKDKVIADLRTTVEELAAAPEPAPQASKTITAMSQRSAAFLAAAARRRPSSPLSSRPAVSSRTQGPMPWISILLCTTSVVVPAVSETMDIF